MIFANGFPKSGNHALAKALELLGIPPQVNHRTFAEGLPEGTTKHVFIIRDPRNVVMSAIRFQGKKPTPGTFLAKFRKFENGSLIEEMAKYEEWLYSNTFVTPFEELIADDAEMRAIARYLDIPYIDGAFEELPGLTVTWSGKLSDYRDIWTPEVESAWNSEGGPELLARWGY